MLLAPPTHRGCTIWLTGLPGEGKSALARAVGDRLRALGRRVEVIDGAAVPREGHGRRGRRARGAHLSWVSRALARNGVFVVAAADAPPRRGPSPVVEVHVDPSLRRCAERDRRGLYRRAFADAVVDALRGHGHLPT